MPIYEYRCANCRTRYSLLLKSFSETPQPCCPRCKNTGAMRIFSTFVTGKTDRAKYEDILNDKNLVRRMMTNDPKALVEWSRRMGDSANDASPEHEEMMQRMEAGESVEKVVTEMQHKELAKYDGESGNSSETGGSDANL